MPEKPSAKTVAVLGKSIAAAFADYRDVSQSQMQEILKLAMQDPALQPALFYGLARACRIKERHLSVPRILNMMGLTAEKDKELRAQLRAGALAYTF